MGKSKQNSEDHTAKNRVRTAQDDESSAMKHIKSIHSKESAVLPGLGTGKDKH